MKKLQFILGSILTLVAIVGNAAAAITVPSGFRQILSDTGVKVYQKDVSGGQPDFVIIVDLRYGTLRSFTGAVSGTSVYRKSLQTYWNDAVAQNTASRKAKVIVNGTFFATNDSNPSPPVGIAFGLKADWWRMSYGYAVNNEYPGLIRTFAYDSPYGSSSIQPYRVQTFDGNIPNVVGGLDWTADKSKNSNVQRTFVGVRDDNNDGNSETVMFYSSKAATQTWAYNTLRSFGSGSIMMLDGGASSGLIINGTKYFSGRDVPQAFVICAGK